MSLDAAHAALREHGADPRVARFGRYAAPLAFFVVLWAPGIGLDPLQRRAAAVTALTAILWLTQALPLGAASLVPVALLPLLGVLSARDAAAVYFNDIVMLFFAASMVASGLEHWGVHRRMALAVVSAVGTRPRALVLGFAAATAFISLWINNTAATLLMYPIGLAVLTTLRAERASSFRIALLLGIAYGSSIGGVATPVGTAPNNILLGTLAELYPEAPTISFGAWMAAWVPFAALYVVALWWVLTRLGLRVGGDELAAGEVVRAERASLGSMSPGERRMAAVFVLTALLWVTREGLSIGDFVLPGWGRWLAELAAAGVPGATASAMARQVSDATVALAVACACFFLPSGEKRGAALLDWDAVQRRMPWDVLLLFGGGFCLARGFEASGLDRALGAALAPLLAGLPGWAVVLAVGAFMTLFSELASNTVLTNLMLPVLAQVAVQSNMDPRFLMMPATIAASLGFMLPVATPPNAIVFSSRMIPMGTMLRVGLWVDLVGVALMTAVFELWGRQVLGIGLALPEWARP
jgi:sodium-dependent dicarboxylate transporter 2/3/5